MLRVVRRTARSRILRLALLLALLAPAVPLVPTPAAATTTDDCGEVMLSIADIAPIVHCETSPIFPNWMTDNATALGQRPLSQVVLPGAHDALTGLYDKNAPGVQWLVQTQDLDLRALLDYGTRAFDMRFCTPETEKNIDLYYACHGGFYDEKVTPATVISDLQSFTNAHPKEILVIEWDWSNRAGSQTLQDNLCSSFFDTFRSIIVPPAVVNGNTTLNEIWALPNQPRIIVTTSSCTHYFQNDPEGSADEDLNWPGYTGGKWANSPFGDVDPNTTGVCNIDVDVEALIVDVVIGLKDLVRLALNALYADPMCTDVATANTLDLTSSLDPSKINGTQALLTATGILEVTQGIYARTVGTPAVTSQWPAIRANLLNLWNNDTNGARPRFNVLWGDFVEHLDLVELAMQLNAGPGVMVTLEDADGATYVPGSGVWTRSIDVSVNCNSTVAFPADDLKSAWTGASTRTTDGASDTFTISTAMTDGSLTVTCTDTSGKIAELTLSGLNIDSTKPVIATTAQVPGPSAYVADTWTNTPVTVTFTCSDTGANQSGIGTDTVSGSTTVSSEGATHSVTPSGVCTDVAGNAATLPAAFGPIKIDTTLPLVTISAQTADTLPYAAGNWTNQNVTVTIQCTEQGSVQSGIATDTVSKSTTVSTEGSAQSVAPTGSCVDTAGNAATLPAAFSPIRIDKTSPLVSVSAKTADNLPYTAGDWTNQDVTVTIQCAEQGSAQSGIASDTISRSETVSTEGAGQSVTPAGACADIAGNAATLPAAFSPINIQKAAPIVTVSAVSKGLAYIAGTWTNADVTVTFDCAVPSGAELELTTDTLSGDHVVSTEGAAHSVAPEGECIDEAGNSAPLPDPFGPIMIDLTIPVITYTGTAANYSILATVKASCSATDGLSGVASTNCKNVNAPAWSYEPGVNTIASGATDKAGNAGAGSTGFSVTATYRDLCTLTRQFVVRSAPNTANKLCGLLETARRADEHGNLATRYTTMTLYMSGITEAVTRRHLNLAQAATLVKWAVTLR